MVILGFGLSFFYLISGLVDTFKEVVQKFSKSLRVQTGRGDCEPFQELVEWGHDDILHLLDGVLLDDLLVHELVECVVVVFFWSVMFFCLDAVLLNQETKRVPGEQNVSTDQELSEN